MKGVLKYFVIGMLLTGIPGGAWVILSKKEPEVLSNQAEDILSPTKTPTPKASSTPGPTPKSTKGPTPIPSPLPTKTPTPKPTFTSEEINGFIEHFATQYGVDPGVLRHIGLCESGLDPNAVNRNYVGLYQFDPITWTTNRVLIGADPNPDLRFNAEESVQTAAFMLKTKGRKFWPNCAP